MKNQFIIKPKEDFVVEVDRMFNIHNSIISIGTEEIRSTISGVDNIIILVGFAIGNNRISNAIEDAVLHSCQIASGYDLFTANKVIIQLRYSTEFPILMKEIEGLTLFAEMFPVETTFNWGISEIQSIKNDRVTACIIASNLKTK